MSATETMPQQTTLGEFDVPEPRCTAIAESTGDRCRRHAVAGTGLCTLHMHLYDPETA